jgi:hypothetical protein
MHTAWQPSRAWSTQSDDRQAAAQVLPGNNLAAFTQPRPQSRSAEASRWYVRLLPSLTDFAFVLPLFLLFGMLKGAVQLLSDGDTGWHIRTGDWILQHGRIPSVDFFSFTMPGQPWFAWEWGWDAFFSIVHHWTGLPGVVFLNVLLLCLSAALVCRLIRRYSDNDILAFAFTLLAVCGSMIHWLARPHLISWVFALLFSHIILSAEQGNRKMLLYAPVLMLFWTNLHGGFFIGIVLLLASALGEALQVTLGPVKPARDSYNKAFAYLASALGCAAATLANPYGWRLHQHVIGYLRDSFLLDNISEFQTISFHNPSSIFFECMLLIGVASAFWCLANRFVALGLTTLVWAHAALFSARNIPVFMLLSAAPAALLTQELLNRLDRSPLFANLAGAVREIALEFKPLERVSRSYLVSGLALLCIGTGLAAGKGVFRSEFNPRCFPAPVLAVVHDAHFNRLFTSDQWADYLIYSYYPSQTAFLDGRSDFYGNDLIRKYQRIMSAQYDCEALLKSFSIDGVLVKASAPLATVLKQSQDWKLLFDNGSAIVFEARKGRIR